jgi:hypothetical protein
MKLHQYYIDKAKEGEELIDAAFWLLGGWVWDVIKFVKKWRA